MHRSLFAVAAAGKPASSCGTLMRQREGAADRPRTLYINKREHWWFGHRWIRGNMQGYSGPGMDKYGSLESSVLCVLSERPAVAGVFRSSCCRPRVTRQALAPHGTAPVCGHALAPQGTAPARGHALASHGTAPARGGGGGLRVCMHQCGPGACGRLACLP